MLEVQLLLAVLRKAQKVWYGPIIHLWDLWDLWDLTLKSNILPIRPLIAGHHNARITLGKVLIFLQFFPPFPTFVILRHSQQNKLTELGGCEDKKQRQSASGTQHMQNFKRCGFEDIKDRISWPNFLLFYFSTQNHPISCRSLDFPNYKTPVSGAASFQYFSSFSAFESKSVFILPPPSSFPSTSLQSWPWFHLPACWPIGAARLESITAPSQAPPSSPPFPPFVLTWHH